MDWNSDNFESDFRRDYNTHYSSTGYSYDRYRPFYLFGFEAGNRYRGRNWTAVEEKLKAEWLRNYPSDVWADVRDAVRTGWERAKGGAGDVRGEGPVFDDYDGDFRSNWQTTYGTTGHGYDQYRPAYQLGYKLATDKDHRAHKWSEIEMEARIDWEMRHLRDAWADYREAIRYAWQRVREDVPAIAE